MLINEKLILINGVFKSKKALIEQLASMAFHVGKIDSPEVYGNCVIQREEKYSTFVGNGIAIPHGKSSAVKEAMVIYAKLAEPIDWDDEDMVDMVFMLGVPEDKGNNLHLEILAKLSRNLMDEEFINKLRESKSPKEVFDRLSNIL
jgi:PTS system fructose-specific IIA component